MTAAHNAERRNWQIKRGGSPTQRHSSSSPFFFGHVQWVDPPDIPPPMQHTHTKGSSPQPPAAIIITEDTSPLHSFLWTPPPPPHFSSGSKEKRGSEFNKTLFLSLPDGTVRHYDPEHASSIVKNCAAWPPNHQEDVSRLRNIISPGHVSSNCEKVSSGSSFAY